MNFKIGDRVKIRIANMTNGEMIIDPLAVRYARQPGSVTSITSEDYEVRLDIGEVLVCFEEELEPGMPNWKKKLGEVK